MQYSMTVIRTQAGDGLLFPAPSYINLSDASSFGNHTVKAVPHLLGLSLFGLVGDDVLAHIAWRSIPVQLHGAVGDVRYPQVTRRRQGHWRDRETESERLRYVQVRTSLESKLDLNF